MHIGNAQKVGEWGPCVNKVHSLIFVVSSFDHLFWAWYELTLLFMGLAMGWTFFFTLIWGHSWTNSYVFPLDL